MQVYQHSEKIGDNKLYNYDPSDGVNTRVSINDSLGYIEFGKKDSFPNFLLDSVDGSHTASSCIDTIITFIEGDGFEQEQLNNLKINDKDTFTDFHGSVSQDEGYFEGFYINVRYNPLGKINYISKLPYDTCRLGIPNKETGSIHEIYYNPYFGTGDYKPDETIIFPVYNPSSVIQEMKDIVELNKAKDEEDEEEVYRGQILFVKENRPQNKFYPIPYYWSGYRWFETERKVGEFHNTNLDNNFFLGGLINMVGDPTEAYSTAEDSNGNTYTTKTVGEAFDEKMSELFSGSGNGGKTFVTWNDIKDDFPQVQAFPTNANDALFVTLQNLAVDNIVIACSVPPVLGNIQVAGKLGASQEISNAVALMHGRIKKRQNKLERTYDMLFANSVWSEIVEPVKISPFEFDLVEFGKEEIVEDAKVITE